MEVAKWLLELGENEMDVNVDGQWALGKVASCNLVVTCELHYDFSYKIMGSKFQPPRLQVCIPSPMC
jgi:hypothetical protein